MWNQSHPFLYRIDIVQSYFGFIVPYCYLRFHSYREEQDNQSKDLLGENETIQVNFCDNLHKPLTRTLVPFLVPL